MRRRVALAITVLVALFLAPVVPVRADLPVPVVLIPGWHGDPAAFDRMVPALEAAGLSVLDFDPSRPGAQALAYAPTTAGQHIPDVAVAVVAPAIDGRWRGPATHAAPRSTSSGTRWAASLPGT